MNCKVQMAKNNFIEGVVTSLSFSICDSRYFTKDFQNIKYR